MAVIAVLAAAMAIGGMGCSREKRQVRILEEAERVAFVRPDSAVDMLEAVDPSDIKEDSLKAKFHYLRAYGHMCGHRSMIGDSLISFAHNYYHGKDVVKNIRSGTALAMYRFWVGDMPGSIRLLDSIAALPGVPDSLMVEALRLRVLLGASDYQGEQIMRLAKRLYGLETAPQKKMEARYMLMAGYLFTGAADSALLLENEFIDYARTHHQEEKLFSLTVERAQLLTEAGREDESDRLIDEIFSKSGPDNRAADLLHFQYAINALNRGDAARAARHLATADSIAFKKRGNDDAFFRSYSNMLHAMIDFRQTGRVKLMQITGLNNRQNERFNRMKASQWESERSALRQQNRALELKAESGRKTVIILIISITALLMLGGSAWIIRGRRQRERDNEERIEALQKMVDEYRSAPAQETEKTDSSAVRGIMLRQLGIIKMVAETPTEQNREMLRRISAIDGETNGGLVDWGKVFELIDSLYSGFYSKLHRQYGDRLSPKEEQIIVLMAAGFSTKEISVITGQTTSTIYVRKSSVRKKLGVPEKEDIVAFLRNRGNE